MAVDPVRTLAPGMEEVIQAGDTLEITDANGQKIAVTAREADNTMAFLKAFDEWLMAKERVPAGHVLDAMWLGVKTTFNNLPMKVQLQLPSLKGGGVIVRNHSHGS